MPYYAINDDFGEVWYDGPKPATDCNACNGIWECSCCRPCRRADCVSCGYRVANKTTRRPRDNEFTGPPWGRHGHRYNRDFEFKGGTGTDGQMYYGMEIEITCERYDPMYYAEELAGDLAWTKYDGSVSGMEMVTHPMTYPFAMSQFPWDMFPKLAQRGCRIIPSDNGIHVHASRAGFTSPEHTYRYMKFWHRNQSDIVRIARRSTDRWASWNSVSRQSQYAAARLAKNPRLGSVRLTDLDTEYNNRMEAITDWWYGTAMTARDERERYRREDEASRWYTAEAERRRAAVMQDRTREGRYQAINSCNTHTLEMRVFASSLDPTTIQSSLQLVASTVEYTRQLTAADVLRNNGWAWDGYREWLAGQPLYAAVKFADKHCKASRYPQAAITTPAR